MRSDIPLIALGLFLLGASIFIPNYLSSEWFRGNDNSWPKTKDDAELLMMATIPIGLTGLVVLICGIVAMVRRK